MSAKLDVTMDASQVEAAYRKLQAENAKLRTSLAGLGTAGTAAGRSIGESLQAIRDPLMRLQLGLANADRQLASGKMNIEAHRAETQRLRTQFEQSASPIEKYTQKLADAQERLRTGKITGETYENQLREMRTEFAGTTTAAERYKAQFEALTRAKKQGTITTDEYKRTVQEAGKETKQLYGAAPAAITSIAGALTGLVGGMLSVNGIVSQIRAAMDEAKQLREEQLRKQLTVGEAQGETVKMLGTVTTPEATKFLTSVQEVGTQAGFQDTAALYLAAADTLSATASDQQLTLSILKQAAPIFKNRPQQIGEFAGAVADLATIQGAKSDAEIKGVISEVLSITSQARITSLSAFKEAAAGIAGATVTDTGADRGRAVRESGAAFAAIGGAIKDPSGSLTKTATSMLATQLERLLPEKDIMGPVSETKRAELLREKAQLQEKVATFDAGGGDAKRATDLAKLEADAKWARSLQTKATTAAATAEVELAKPSLPAEDRKRLTGTAAEQTASAERHGARAAQLEQQLQQRRSTMSAAALADAAEVDLARKRMTRIDQEMTGTIRKGTGAKTLAERMAIVQADPEQQRLFFEGDTQQGIGEAAFRGPIEPVIRELLTRKESEAARRFETALGAISADTATYDQLVANLREASPQLRLTENVRTAEVTTEGKDQAADSSARRTAVQEQAAAALLRTRRGFGVLDRLNELGEAFRGKMSDDQGVMEAQIAQVLLRRQSIANMPMSEQSRIGLRPGESDQGYAVGSDLRGPRLALGLQALSSERDRARVAKLDAPQRQQVEYLDRMLQQLMAIASDTVQPAIVPIGKTVDAARADAVPLRKTVDAARADAVPLRQTPDTRQPAAVPLRQTPDAARADAVPRAAQPAQPPRAEPARPQPPAAVSTDPAVLAELKRIADATSETRDAATKRPAVGASAAAAVPSSQRLGR